MHTLADSLRGQPFELILSSGFFGFFAHTGVVAALEEAGLLPAAVGGSSAGALVAGLWGAGLRAAQMRDRLFQLRRQDFWDPDPLFGLGAARPGLLRGARFDALLRESLDLVGVRRFAECRLPVRVVVFDVATRRAALLTEGELAPALRASCSVPGLFQPVRLGARHYLDGGVTDRPGILAASPGARLLYHHLPTHSPWRRFTPRQNQVPQRPGLSLLYEPALPRLSPFHLERGPQAYELARAMTLRTLGGPADPAL